MSQITTGDDAALYIELKRGAAGKEQAFNIPTTAVVRAAVIRFDHTARLSPVVTVNPATPGGDWTKSLVVLKFSTTDTAAITKYGPAKIQIQIDDNGKQSYYIDTLIVKGQLDDGVPVVPIPVPYDPAFDGVFATLATPLTNRVEALEARRDQIQDVTFADASDTIDLSLGNIISVGLVTADLTIVAPANPVEGRRYIFIFPVDGDGGHTVTFPDGVTVTNMTANNTYASEFIYVNGDFVRVN